MMNKWNVADKRWTVSSDGYTITTEPETGQPVRIVARCQTVIIARDIVNTHNTTLVEHIETEKAFLTGTHRIAFRSGKQAEILEVLMTTPVGLEQRACFRIRFADGTEDLVPVGDQGNYELSARDSRYDEV